MQIKLTKITALFTEKSLICLGFGLITSQKTQEKQNKKNLEKQMRDY